MMILACLRTPIHGFCLADFDGKLGFRSATLLLSVANLFDREFETFGTLGDATGVLGEEYRDPRFLSPGAPRPWLSRYFWHRLMSRDTFSRQPKIRDYALVGDCHGAALISHGGSVDWLTLRRFDADPVFCRILDADLGGYFSISPSDAGGVERAYLQQTNILETTFTTDPGSIRITDFMPVGRRPGSRVHDARSRSWAARRSSFRLILLLNRTPVAAHE